MSFALRFPHPKWLQRPTTLFWSVQRKLAALAFHRCRKLNFSKARFEL
jgi:hypothetical protein